MNYEAGMVLQQGGGHYEGKECQKMNTVKIRVNKTY